MQSIIYRYSWQQIFLLNKQKISDHFLDALEKYLRLELTNKLGLDPLTFPNFVDIDPNIHGTLDQKLVNSLLVRVCTRYKVFNVLVKWKSKSSAIVLPSDEVNLEDIEIWFDNLDVKELLYYLNYMEKPDFKVPKVKYSVEVFNFNPDSIRLNIESKDVQFISAIESTIDNILESHNLNSLEKNRKSGIVHDFGVENTDGKNIIYYIDIGSAPLKLIKTIVKKLDDQDWISKITIK